MSETTKPMTNEQAQAVVQELRRHLMGGATIRASGPVVLEPQQDGNVFGGLEIRYPAGSVPHGEVG